MTNNEIITLATSIMSGNNKLNRDLISEGWKFAISNTKRALGDCHFGKRVIRVSAYYAIGRTKAEIVETITHEMAHAIAAEKGDYGHGTIWRNTHRALGGKGSRTGTVTNRDLVAKPAYVVYFKNAKGELEIAAQRHVINKAFREKVQTGYIPGRRDETLYQMKITTRENYDKLVSEQSTFKMAAETVKDTSKQSKTPKQKSEKTRVAHNKIIEAAKSIFNTTDVLIIQQGKYNGYYVVVDGKETRIDVFKKKYM